MLQEENLGNIVECCCYRTGFRCDCGSVSVRNRKTWESGRLFHCSEGCGWVYPAPTYECSRLRLIILSKSAFCTITYVGYSASLFISSKGCRQKNPGNGTTETECLSPTSSGNEALNTCRHIYKNFRGVYPGPHSDLSRRTE